MLHVEVKYSIYFTVAKRAATTYQIVGYTSTFHDRVCNYNNKDVANFIPPKLKW